ncbi:XdhC family protein [Sinorhizobium meliloti]|nr:XdhC family protein [Sinorhizobium meliloti]
MNDGTEHTADTQSRPCVAARRHRRRGSFGRQQSGFCRRRSHSPEWAAPVSEALHSGRPRLLKVEERAFFINVHLPPPRIVAIGAVHISQALAHLAPVAGFDMAVIDPRTAFATPSVSMASSFLQTWPEDVLPARAARPYTAVALSRHDPKIDDYPIRAALKRDASMSARLAAAKPMRPDRTPAGARGAGGGDRRIKAPIGLDIGAASRPRLRLPCWRKSSGRCGVAT